MTWGLASIALVVLAVLAVSQRLEGTSVTAQMLFAGLGVLIGPLVLDGFDVSAAAEPLRALVDATLALVLFSDASRVDLRRVWGEHAIPVRLLGVALPLTIVLGTLAAIALFGGLTGAEALVLAIVLAPTDAALGQAVVTDERLPMRIRQGLNVESGLNDGLCVPLLFVAIAAADVESSLASGATVVRVASEEIGYGLLAGLIAGLVTGGIVVIAGARGLVAPVWRPVAPVAGAALAYGLAVGLGGSGFIAAFVAGAFFGWLLHGDTAEIGRFGEELGDLLDGVTFVIFGALLLGPALEHVSWQIALYAVLSLTLVRMLAVAVAMVGSRARAPTVAFLGWFGPRGLASIVFALIVIQGAHLPGGGTIVQTAYITVGLSTFAHGASANPLVARYARWLASHPQHRLSPAEAAPARAFRARGARGARVSG